VEKGKLHNPVTLPPWKELLLTLDNEKISSLFPVLRLSSQLAPHCLTLKVELYLLNPVYFYILPYCNRIACLLLETIPLMLIRESER